MNFQQAKDKLKKLAKGKYHSISYEISEYPPDGLEQKCSVYISGYNWEQEKTWELAFKELKLNPPFKKPVIIDSIEEIKKEV